MNGSWGKMVSARGIAPACTISLVNLDEATKGLNLVDVKRHYNLERYQASRSVLG